MKRLVLALSAVVVGVVVSSCAVGVRQPATEITDTSATLNGEVLSTTGGPGSWYVEYGPTTARTERTPTRTIDFVVGQAEPVSEPVDGLEPGTTYHFAVCAEDSENPGDPFCSPDQTFTTSGPPVGEDFVTGTSVGPRECVPELCFSPVLVFDAHSGPSGESPTGTVRLDIATEGGDTFTLDTARVTCLNVAGNRAAVGVHFPMFVSGLFFVEDNDGAGQDRSSPGGPPIPTPTPSVCPSPTDPSTPLTPIADGDITVHDAQPFPTSKD